MSLIRNKFKNLGFTLIELLVVISVIGLLSSVVLVIANKSRREARNARMVQDLKAVGKALELYYDANGSVPISPDSGVNLSTDPALAAALAPYISKLPYPPNSSYGYTYLGKKRVGNVQYWLTVGPSCFVFDNAYLLYVPLEPNAGNNALAANDGGVISYMYEVYGGEYRVKATPCP